MLYIIARVSMVIMNRLLDRVHFLYIITMVTKNVMNRLLDRVHFLYSIVYLWQPGYDDKLDECEGEPQWEHTHIVTVVQWYALLQTRRLNSFTKKSQGFFQKK